MNAVRVLLLIFFSYLLGSIPTAYLMGRIFMGIDIREHGSGNVGATNVLRVLGPFAGVTTLAIDLLKGYITVAILTPLFYPDAGEWPIFKILACVSVIAGHNWMIFLGLKGGKGVATTAGAFLALAPWATISAISVWGVVVALTRYVSLGSIMAGLSLPLFMWLTGRPGAYIWFSAVLTVALLIKHRGNIKRLLNGTENKIEFAGRLK